jgi:hypothetical protein
MYLSSNETDSCRAKIAINCLYWLFRLNVLIVYFSFCRLYSLQISAQKCLTSSCPNKWFYAVTIIYLRLMLISFFKCLHRVTVDRITDVSNKFAASICRIRGHATLTSTAQPTDFVQKSRSGSSYAVQRNLVFLIATLFEVFPPIPPIQKERRGKTREQLLKCGYM